MSTIPEKMIGVFLTGHGGLDQLEYRKDIPVPEPKTNEVLIKVGAAGVNNTDVNTRIGWYSKSDNPSEDATWAGQALKFPRIQGIDVCGEIVGTSVEAFGFLINRFLVFINKTAAYACLQPFYRIS